MGLKERILEIQELQRNASEEEDARLAEQQAQAAEISREKESRFDGERDPMILQQRALFEELRNVGLVGMIEEMTVPSPVWLPKTEEEIALTDPDGPLWKPVAPPTSEEFVRHALALGSQEWKARLATPHMLPNGDPDPVLRILIDNDLPLSGVVKDSPITRISISYTREKLLTIEGSSKTFVGTVAPDMSSQKREMMEEGLAKAFASPLVVEQRKRAPFMRLGPPDGRLRAS